MARLTPEQQELVRAGRDALKPTAADRERVLQALALRVGGGEGVAKDAASEAARAPVAASGTIPKVVAVLTGIAFLGGVAFFGLREHAPSASSAPVATPRSEASTSVEASTEARPAIPSSPTAQHELGDEELVAEPVTRKTVGKKQIAANAPQDTLAQEVAILSRASAKLHGGQPAEALAMLSEHRRMFPRGVLQQECIAARVQAFCALGRVTEAKSELERLAKLAPRSPLAAGARKACGGALE
jgi:hypothetical protein